MARLFQHLHRNEPNPLANPAGAPGKRCYAIGDVHGRRDLLQDIFDRIEARESDLPQAQTFVVMLGDLIDRGPDSRGVLDFLIGRANQGPTLISLMGNHEEMLLAALTGDRNALRRWLANGGDACLRSYDLSPAQLEPLDGPALVHTLESAIPAAHREFLARCADSVRFGDYRLVHAGIRPGQPLDRQSQSDLRWIRTEFLDSQANHGVIVIHGHSNLAAVERRSNRIGIDTSAHRTGVLTAIAIEGSNLQFLQTAEADIEACKSES